MTFCNKRPGFSPASVYGGGGRIRTSEVYDGRFTVCSLWPLGNPSRGSLFNFLGCPAPAAQWSWRQELNPQPADYKSAALPIELRQHRGRYIQQQEANCKENFPLVSAAVTSAQLYPINRIMSNNKNRSSGQQALFPLTNMTKLVMYSLHRNPFGVSFSLLRTPHFFCLAPLPPNGAQPLPKFQQAQRFAVRLPQN